MKTLKTLIVILLVSCSSYGQKEIIKVDYFSYEQKSLIISEQEYYVDQIKHLTDKKLTNIINKKNCTLKKAITILDKKTEQMYLLEYWECLTGNTYVTKEKTQDIIILNRNPKRL